MLLDYVRDTVANQSFIPYYAPLSTVLGVPQGILLLAAAQGIYLGPAIDYKSFPREVVRHRVHLGVFLLFVGLSVGAVAYNVLFSPYSAATATDLAGRSVTALTLDPRFIAVVFVLLLVFLAYPTTLLILGASKVENQEVKGSIFGLAIGWAVVSVLYVLAVSAMWVLRIDAMGPMYLTNSVIFFFVIRKFRMSAALAGYVEPKPSPVGREAATVPDRLTALTESITGKKILYEVDPAIPYETTLGQTLEELAWAGHAVFVFTPKASLLHNVLTGATGLKFFLTTTSVSYVQVSEETHDMLIPQSDTAIFLDLADKTLASRKGNVVFVFDNVSELLLLVGMEKTYKFLKLFLEILNEPRATAFFIFIGKAHDPKDANLLRGLFPNIFVEDAAGARLIK